MKRFWLVLLSLGLIVAFSTSAMAVDVKFSGSFYAAGMYQDKTTLMKGSSEGQSTAFYYQRLRVGTEFVVSPGLKLVTRFDAMERAWGAARTTSTATAPDSAGTFYENENIAFDEAYISYASPIGDVKAGYKEVGLWGTDFANNGKPKGIIYFGHYFDKIGLYTWGQIVKASDLSYTAKNSTATAADRDLDEYQLGVHFYGIKNVEIALLYEYYRDATTRGSGYQTQAHILEPYVKGKIGPVAFEAEIDYAFGKYVKSESSSDMDLSQLQAYVKAIATFGPVYVGGLAAYVQGDDPGTSDKLEGYWLSGGREFKPCLILFNSERSDWAGTLPGYGNNGVYGNANGPMQNAWFLQFIAGVKPVQKLDIMATVAYANADKKPDAYWLYNNYGTEVDLTATYKITNNLSYMLGGGYLFTGKYFKGYYDSYETRDNFLIINKLTLTF